MDNEDKFNKNVWRVLNKIKQYSLDLLQDNPEVEYRSVEYPVSTEQEFSVEDEYEAIDLLIKNEVLQKLRPTSVAITSEKNPYLQQNTELYWVNKPKFLELYDKLSKIYLEEATPKGKLSLDNNGKATYTSSGGITKDAKFNKNTSEYLILNHLAMTPGIAVETTHLIDKLKTNRNNADYADPKQRVLDKIKAIRNKLGSEVIKTTPNGYVIDCEVTKK